MTSTGRSLFVPADRLLGWVQRFCAAHGGQVEVKDMDDGVMLRMRDGASALLTAPWPDAGRPGRGAGLVERLASLALQERRLGLVLVRRGGYGIGIAVAGRLVTHKVGTASARSRGGDRGATIVARAAEQTARQFAGAPFEYLATGGDLALTERMLSAPALRKVASLPRVAPIPCPDPKMAVLEQAAKDFCAVRVTVTDP